MDKRMDYPYMAEVGRHGWSQLCRTLEEARRAVDARRAWLREQYGLTINTTHDREYRLWAIWDCRRGMCKVGGNWPV